MKKKFYIEFIGMPASGKSFYKNQILKLFRKKEILTNDYRDLSRINKLIEQTQLVKFINEQEFGINTMVGERGVQISGGQRQRIGIARALYHNPSILILDEATSALDSDTENEIMKSITNLKEDKTIIIIAHRLNTLMIADSVYSIMEKKIKKIDKANLFKTLN